MRDHLRRSRAIREAFTQGYPGQPSGTVARPLSPLAALISGMGGSTSTPLPPIAAQVPNGTKPASRVKRFARWCDNADILEAVYFLPSADLVLRHLALQTVGLVMEGSSVGRGGTALLSHVVYKGRSLPLAWRVRQAPQGHCPADLHSAMLTLRREVRPEGSQGGLLGDGEFAGTALPAPLQAAGWSYVCRTAMRTVATGEGEPFRLDTLGACSKAGPLVALSEGQVTRDADGPVMVRSCWAKGYHEPLYRVSNRATAEAACRWYGKRFRIATFFSDQKSRGVHIQKSPMSDVQRLSRF